MKYVKSIGWKWREPLAVTWRSYDLYKEMGLEGVDWIHLA